MPSKRLHPKAAFAALASTMLLGSAHAAIYTGSWDPAFGAPFANLGWRGQASYFVPDACLALADGDVANSNPCSGGSMSVLSATVSFYNLSAPGVTLETLNFGTSLKIDSVTLASHKLTGSDTAFAPVVHANSAIAGGGNYSFTLKFVDATAILAYVTEPESAGKAHYFLSSSVPTVVYTPAAVPEPGTMALWASGLAAMGLLVRRRRR